MKKAYILSVTVIMAGLILNGCFKEEAKVFGSGDTGEVVDYAKANCEKSGGIFADSTCTCAEGYSYNEKSGLCADEKGTPGGEFGTEIKGETTIEVEVQ